jgi:poly-D-alanine transfer protein DltD
MADVLGKVLKRLGKKKVDEMDEAAKRMAGSPGYDEGTMEAQKEVAKKKGLTAAEKKALQEELNAPAKKSRTLEQVEKEYTPAERKRMEEALKKIGRESTKMAKGGMPTKKYAKGGMGMANCGASVKPNGGSRNK